MSTLPTAQLRNEWLNLVRNKISLKAALFFEGSEITAAGYVRADIDLTVASGGSATNDGVVTFPTALAEWTYDQVVIVDGGGSDWPAQPFEENKTVPSAEVLGIPDGVLDLKFVDYPGDGFYIDGESAPVPDGYWVDGVNTGEPPKIIPVYHGAQ